MNKLIRGIVPALCTPFDENGELAVNRVPALIRSLINTKVTGFFVCGSGYRARGSHKHTERCGACQTRRRCDLFCRAS